MAADIANLGQLEEDGEHGDEERRLARFLIGGSMLRRRRLRRLLLAHLLRSRAGEEGEVEDDDEEDGADEHRLARLLIGGSMLRAVVCAASFSRACFATRPSSNKV